MRLSNIWLILVLLGICTGVAYADPAGQLDEKPWSYDFGPTRATIIEVEPNDVCPGMTVACGDVVEPGQIATGTDYDYYTLLSVPGGSVLTFGTDASGTMDPDVGDSYLELFYNCGTTRVAYDDDSGPGLYSLLTYTVPAGSPGTYSIRVRGYSASYTGYYKLSIACTTPQPPPVNNLCSGAIVLSRCMTGTVNGDLTYATNDYDPGVPGPSCTGYPAAGKDVTYKVDLLAGDVVDLTYNGSPTAFDGSIYMVTDCANASGTCVAGADTYPNPPGETIHYVVVNPGTYYIICDAYGTNTGGPFVLGYTFTCPTPTGACCNHLTGECVITTQADCQAPFVWLGIGVPCNIETCPPPLGACCDHATGNCAVMPQDVCQFDWLGPYVPCNVETCPPVEPTGACCDFTTGACTVTTQPVCQFTWLGPFVPCNSVTCPLPPPPTGACCDHATGNCAVTTQADCQFDWLGAGVPCDEVTCPSPPPTGACCNEDIGFPACMVTTMVDCVTMGPPWHYLGDLVPCNAVVCVAALPCTVTFDVADYQCAGPQTWRYTIGGTAANCGNNYSIKVEIFNQFDVVIHTQIITVTNGAANWQGVFFGPSDGTWARVWKRDDAGKARDEDFTEIGEQSLPAGPCGACCYPDGHCESAPQEDCATGDWRSDVPCDPNPCPPPPPETGACCDHATGDCVVTTQAACPFDWLGDGVPCNTETCPLPPPVTGACCDHATGDCVVTIQAACPFDWLGAGVPCNTDTCPPPTGACCDHATGSCTITTEAACAFQWLGAGVPCNLETCVPPVPTERTSWGQIKNTYR
jgi:hypothetical protein